jgi:hypothetical protein
MVERNLRNNYFLTLIKFVLFLLILCFIVEISKAFFKEIETKEDFNLNIFYLSILSPFLFYAFVANLNNLYKKIQDFFFRSTIFSYFPPSLLIFLGIGFILIPKIFNFAFNKNIFLFSGGFVATMHLIFIARQNRGGSFSTFINYLFNFSILYIINLILFTLYLKIGFDLNLKSIFIEGTKKGVSLIQNTFTQIFK